MSNITVLKFGSSVLHSPEELPVAVHEIYSELREHRRVIAAVSAFEGETDRLFAEATKLGLDSDPHAVAAHVAKGEQETATQLVKVLNEAGVPAKVADPRDFGFHAEGPALDASPYALDTANLNAQLRDTPVLVVPGFYASDKQGRIVLLGRGGTDLTALYIAQRLGAACRLVKDVDGIYENDPARSKSLPPRFERVSWEHALEVGGKLVQPRAIRFAQEHKQVFGVGAAGNVQTTLVGPGPDTFKALPHPAPLRVVLLGLGTVGLGVYRYLKKRPDLFDVRRVVVRDVNKPREESFTSHEKKSLLSADVWDAVNEPADLIIEAIGGVEPAAQVVQAALEKGRAVVTANKAMIAARWREFAPYVCGPTRQLRFSAAVGGAVPVLEVLETLLRKEKVTRVRGVINGTCNFILDALAGGGSFADAVKQAQDRGFAEADPRSDLSGEDAGFKLGIISSIAFGSELALDKIERTGIEQITAEKVAAARARKRNLRLVGTGEADAGGVRLSVQPRELDDTDFLAGAQNEENRVEIFTAGGECIRLSGKGAGRWPTAVAVLGDVYAQLRQPRTPEPADPSTGRLG